MPVSAIVEISIVAFIAVAAMSAYDYLLRRQFKLDVDWKATFRYAWIANTFNNMIGFAGLTGVGLRAILVQKERRSDQNDGICCPIPVPDHSGWIILAWLARYFWCVSC